MLAMDALLYAAPYPTCWVWWWRKMWWYTTNNNINYNNSWKKRMHSGDQAHCTCTYMVAYAQSPSASACNGSTPNALQKNAVKVLKLISGKLAKKQMFVAGHWCQIVKSSPLLSGVCETTRNRTRCTNSPKRTPYTNSPKFQFGEICAFFYRRKPCTDCKTWKWPPDWHWLESSHKGKKPVRAVRAMGAVLRPLLIGGRPLLFFRQVVLKVCEYLETDGSRWWLTFVQHPAAWCRDLSLQEWQRCSRLVWSMLWALSAVFQ